MSRERTQEQVAKPRMRPCGITPANGKLACKLFQIKQFLPESDWCVQLRFEFVYPYHAHHKTVAAEPLTIPTTD